MSISTGFVTREYHTLKFIIRRIFVRKGVKNPKKQHLS